MENLKNSIFILPNFWVCVKNIKGCNDDMCTDPNIKPVFNQWLIFILFHRKWLSDFDDIWCRLQVKYLEIKKCTDQNSFGKRKLEKFTACTRDEIKNK